MLAALQPIRPGIARIVRITQHITVEQFYHYLRLCLRCAPDGNDNFKCLISGLESIHFIPILSHLSEAELSRLIPMLGQMLKVARLQVSELPKLQAICRQMDVSQLVNTRHCELIAEKDSKNTAVEHIDVLGEILPNMEILQVSCSILGHFPVLEKVRILSLTNVSQANLDDLLQKCPRLKQLQLNDKNDSTSVYDIQNVGLCKLIKVLLLPLEVKTPLAICQLANLSHLSLQCKKLWSESAWLPTVLAIIQAKRFSLERLTIDGSWLVGPLDVSKLQLIKCTGLKELRLSNCKVADAVENSLPLICQRLSLRQCTLSMLHGFLATQQMLKHLELFECQVLWNGPLLRQLLGLSRRQLGPAPLHVYFSQSTRLRSEYTKWKKEELEASKPWLQVREVESATWKQSPGMITMEFGTPIDHTPKFQLPVESIPVAADVVKDFDNYLNALASAATPMGENASLITPPTSRTTTLTVATGPTGSHVLMLGEAQRRQQEDEETTVGDTWSDRPDTATLTKGFSIPTYLPPFPDFIPADLPHLLRNASEPSPPADPDVSRSGSPAMPSSEQSRLHAYDSEQKAQQLRREKELAKERELLPRRLLSLPPLNATVQAGQHAYLPCKLNQHSGKPLSWVRLRDEHIIAVDHTTFINDARFASLLQSSAATTIASGAKAGAGAGGGAEAGAALPTTVTISDASGNASAHEGQESGNGSSLSWTLQIKYVKLEDAGWYECQLATEPKMSAKVQLFVITPRTELIGDRQRFVKAGSKVELHCIVRGTLEAPQYIFWYRGDQQVTAENEASGAQSGWYTQIDRNIFGSTEHNRNTIGSLVIPLVRKIHSGNYTCEPENSAAVSMQLHVLSGEYSASAIKSTAAGLHRLGHGYSSLHQWLIFLLVALNKT